MEFIKSAVKNADVATNSCPAQKCGGNCENQSDPLKKSL